MIQELRKVTTDPVFSELFKTRDVVRSEREVSFDLMTCGYDGPPGATAPGFRGSLPRIACWAGYYVNPPEGQLVFSL